MFIICGLGNPGERYKYTRHNVGARVVDRLAQRWGLGIKSAKFQSKAAKTVFSGNEVLLMLPQTFMNLSGEAVIKAMNFYKMDPEDLLVVHDEMDLELGRIKCKLGGGTAGHKGLDSIVNSLGTDNYIRIRFGIGRPSDNLTDSTDWVLSNFTVSEESIVKEKIENAADAVEQIISNGIIETMNRFNRDPNKEAKSGQDLN